MASKTELYIDGRTDIGTRRTNNEDAWWAGQADGPPLFMVPGPEVLCALPARLPVLLQVSDGVGGAKAGEVASRLAVETVATSLLQNPCALQSPREAILSAMTEADRLIKSRASEPGLDGMGATLSLLFFTGNGSAQWGHAGDSRIYVSRRGKLRQISRDHSPVSRMRQRGELTEAEARRHPQRNQIDQSLGNPEGAFQPDCGSEEIQPGDVFLVCSDGLIDGLWDYEIERILAGVRSPSLLRRTVNRLIDSAIQASGRDNITAVVALATEGHPVGAARTGPSFWRRLMGKASALASAL